MQTANADMVHRLLPYPYLIDALAAAHREDPPQAEHIISNEPLDGQNQFVTLVGWKPRSGIAVKMVGVFPNNLAHSPPQASVQGLVALFDPATGAPRLVADGEAMTFRKTAADSGLGSRLLARADSETLLVVGAGGLAPHVVKAHLAAQPSVRRVLIWNRTFAKAETLAADLISCLPDCSATHNLDEAVSQADIISCVTMSHEPLVKGSLLKPGAHLDLIGAYLPDMRETDDEAMIRGSIFLDCRDGMKGTGELTLPIEAGAIEWSDIQADLYQLCQGAHPGRTSADEITIFKNVGGGHLDLFTAISLHQRLS